MEEHRTTKWRKEITNLSDKDLLDELQRPIGDWQEDVGRETLRRILSRLPKKVKPKHNPLLVKAKGEMSGGNEPYKKHRKNKKKVGVWKC